MSLGKIVPNLFLRTENTIGMVMLVETVKLASIVMKFTPQMYSFLKKIELDSDIVLVNGMNALEEADAMEIIQFSISEHQKDAFIQ
ncbi:hypothetical protein [Gorillibacterium massiliense]|uniref:hypothetical protein n=1 Tax=Gorillibacterium massiliense TaxID=1280390 RepID=UPI00307BC1D3